MVNRYELGKNKMETMIGTAGNDVLVALEGQFEDVGKYILEFVFADLGTRGILEDKHREMITIVSLISQGDTESQLKMHINSALRVGLSQAEIIETIIQCIPHVGFPKTLNAVWIAKDIFEKSNM